MKQERNSALWAGGETPNGVLEVSVSCLDCNGEELDESWLRTVAGKDELTGLVVEEHT